jgi:hypothetical protein
MDKAKQFLNNGLYHLAAKSLRNIYTYSHADYSDIKTPVFSDTSVEGRNGSASCRCHELTNQHHRFAMPFHPSHYAGSSCVSVSVLPSRSFFREEFPSISLRTGILDGVDVASSALSEINPTVGAGERVCRLRK